MLEKCICCGNPISAYPCKFCKAEPVPFECPRLNGSICSVSKKLCKNKREWVTCELLNRE
jgi:hypothetical protein